MLSLDLPRLGVTGLFVTAIAAVVWLDRHDATPSATTGAPIDLRFEEVAAASGLDFRHEPFAVDPAIANIAAHVSGLGASVALADYDGDGWLDVFTTSSKAGTENALFRNRGDGTFENVTAAAGLTGANSAERGHSMGGVFGDLDGDADRDLLLFRFGRPTLYRNDSGRFTDVTAASGLDLWINCPCATFLDYDRDGRLDVYLAGYFREEIDFAHLTTTEVMQNSFEFATNGGRDRLFHNEGGLVFRDVTEGAGIDTKRWTLAVAAADFDGDGFQDLYLANDYGPEELYRNVNGERFELDVDARLSDKSKSGMCVAIGDFTNEGRPGVYVTNICRAGYLLQGNNLRRNLLAESGKFDNVADERAVADCGWAWGAQFGDLDNDGWQDLFVVNGFLSQSRERDYWYSMGKIASGAGDAFVDATRWPPIGDSSLSGYERSHVLRNLEGERFRDVAQAAGVTDLRDGRGIALGDLFHTGRLDAVIANHAGPLLLYRNDSPRDRHWIQFELRGTGGNQDAIGACVWLDFPEGREGAGGRGPCRIVTAASGFAAQNDSRLHFGLGARNGVRFATVRWPSGKEQTIENPKIDAVNVIEEAAP